MYLKGTVSINLEGTQLKMKSPKNFFGGVANLITEKSWSSQKEHETFKIMALAQANYRVLKSLGVNNVARIALGDVVIYEDFENRPNDFPLAMKALQKKVEEGLDLGYLEKFDLILRHDDGVLSYVIDFDIFREHEPGVDPITIRVTALSSELRRDENESEDAYMERVRNHFASQKDFNKFRNNLEKRFETFLDGICEKFNDRLGIKNITVDWNTHLIRKGEIERDWSLFTGYGYPFYAFNPFWDLYYLSIWSTLFYDQGLEVEQFEYVEPDGTVLAEVDDTAWTDTDFETSDESGAGGIIEVAAAESDSGAGGDIEVEATKESDSGGGGWLDSVSDFFDSDSAGGGDIDVGDAGCGGCTGCGGCGGCGGA